MDIDCYPVIFLHLLIQFLNFNLHWFGFSSLPHDTTAQFALIFSFFISGIEHFAVNKVDSVTIVLIILFILLLVCHLIYFNNHLVSSTFQQWNHFQHMAIVFVLEYLHHSYQVEYYYMKKGWFEIIFREKY
jgi:hypothetical protein